MKKQQHKLNTLVTKEKLSNRNLGNEKKIKEDPKQRLWKEVRIKENARIFWENPGPSTNLPQDMQPSLQHPGEPGNRRIQGTLMTACIIAGMGPCSPALNSVPHDWKHCTNSHNFSSGPRHLCYRTQKSGNV